MAVMTVPAAAQSIHVPAADSCVAVTALQFARYTDENAAMVAEYAARSCADQIAKASNGTAGQMALFKTLAVKYSLRVAEWRARIARDPLAFDAIERELVSRGTE